MHRRADIPRQARVARENQGPAAQCHVIAGVFVRQRLLRRGENFGAHIEIQVNPVPAVPHAAQFPVCAGLGALQFAVHGKHGAAAPRRNAQSDGKRLFLVGGNRQAHGAVLRVFRMDFQFQRRAVRRLGGDRAGQIQVHHHTVRREQGGGGGNQTRSGGADAGATAVKTAVGK